MGVEVVYLYSDSLFKVSFNDRSLCLLYTQCITVTRVDCNPCFFVYCSLYCSHKLLEKEFSLPFVFCELLYVSKYNPVPHLAPALEYARLLARTLVYVCKYGNIFVGALPPRGNTLWGYRTPVLPGSAAYD